MSVLQIKSEREYFPDYCKSLSEMHSDAFHVLVASTVFILSFDNVMVTVKSRTLSILAVGIIT